jgi:hypothetical protein
MLANCLQSNFTLNVKNNTYRQLHANSSPSHRQLIANPSPIQRQLSQIHRQLIANSSPTTHNNTMKKQQTQIETAPTFTARCFVFLQSGSVFLGGR